MAAVGAVEVAHEAEADAPEAVVFPGREVEDTPEEAAIFLGRAVAIILDPEGVIILDLEAVMFRVRPPVGTSTGQALSAPTETTRMSIEAAGVFHPITLLHGRNRPDKESLTARLSYPLPLAWIAGERTEPPIRNLAKDLRPSQPAPELVVVNSQTGRPIGMCQTL